MSFRKITYEEDEEDNDECKNGSDHARIIIPVLDEIRH
jgi:hypothetical protein